MKLTTLIGAAMAAVLMLATSALAADFGAHNPSLVDHPDVPNCTLVGPHSYANDPSCETVTGGGTYVHASTGVVTLPPV